ncbi:MAG: transglutaminase family protein [Isosphaeraceae bacterium]
MLYRIQHETKLSYSLPVFETVFEVRMAPPSDEDQTSLSYRLRTTPQAPVTSFRDGFGNRAELFNLASPYRELTVAVTSYVRTHRRSAAARLSQSGAHWHGPHGGPNGEGRTGAIDALEFLHASPLVPSCPELDNLASSLDLPPAPMLDTLQRLMAEINSRLKYEKDVTRARTPVSESLRLGRGVCQDFAHVFIGTCRALGVPARYVSGYLAHPGEIATHAWCQVWADDTVGWVDVDPTHNDFANDEYILTAIGRDYHDVPPNRGLWKGRAEESMSVTVKVDPVDRVPIEWNDWYPPAFRSGAAPGSARSGMNGARLMGRPRTPYPHQPPAGAGLVNQQSEQQQQE